MLNAYCACRKATLYFSPAIAAKVEFLVTDIVMYVLLRFSIIAQRSKGTHNFHRVVGLVVSNIRQCIAAVSCWSVQCLLRNEFFLTIEHIVMMCSDGPIVLNIVIDYLLICVSFASSINSLYTLVL